MKTRIVFKLTTLCFSLVFFTSVLLYYFSNDATQRSLRKEIVAELKALTNRGVDNIDRFLFERASDLKMMAKDPIIHSAMTSGDTLQLLKRLEQIKQTNELYYSVSVFDMQRTRLADTEFRDVGKVHSYSKYWKNINLATNFTLDISRSESLDRNVIHFASIIRDNKGKAEGVLVARILLEELYEVFDDLHLESNPEIKNHLKIELINQEGLVLYTNHDKENILKSTFNKELLNNIQKNEAELFEFEKRFYSHAIEKGYRSFKGNKWTLITAIDEEIAFRPLNQLSHNLLKVILAVTVIAALVALIFARRFSKPIIALTKAADKIGEGDLDVEININTHDEIHELGQHIKGMATKLKNKIVLKEQLNHQLNNTLAELASKNDELTASIRYAQRIQKSMLPEEETLKEYFEDSFILYSPRDIVSGDFYWFETVRDKITQQQKFVIAAADCTGHGVPGAIMSMLGSNLLTNIVCYGHQTQPSEILRRLNHDIIVELHQEGRIDNSQDGMEAALCSFDFQQRKVLFSGAGRPLYIYRNDELIEIKGNRQNVGGVNALARKRGIRFNAEDVEFDIQEGDQFYMFSDGYADQLGGPRDRKMTRKMLKKILSEVHTLPMLEQCQVLKARLENWKGKERQTDDVMVIGLKY